MFTNQGLFRFAAVYKMVLFLNRCPLQFTAVIYIGLQVFNLGSHLIWCQLRFGSDLDLAPLDLAPFDLVPLGLAPLSLVPTDLALFFKINIDSMKYYFFYILIPNRTIHGLNGADLFGTILCLQPNLP